MQGRGTSIIRGMVIAIFGLEAIGCCVVAAVHLGAGVDVPGYVHPQAAVAGVAALCGAAFVGAAVVALTRPKTAWEVGVGAQMAGVVGMLVIDKVLAVTDVTAIYRIGMAVAGVVGILLITSAGKAALGRDGQAESHDNG